MTAGITPTKHCVAVSYSPVTCWAIHPPIHPWRQNPVTLLLLSVFHAGPHAVLSLCSPMSHEIIASAKIQRILPQKLILGACTVFSLFQQSAVILFNVSIYFKGRNILRCLYQAAWADSSSFITELSLPDYMLYLHQRFLFMGHETKTFLHNQNSRKWQIDDAEKWNGHGKKTEAHTRSWHSGSC